MNPLIKMPYRYISILILLFLIAIVGIGCNDKGHADRSRLDRIRSLIRSCSYEQILTEFDSYPWTRENDPEMFMAYSLALVETGNKITDKFKSPSLQQYKSEFMQAYIESHQGKGQLALKRYLNLTGDKDGQIWGYIGLLEYALDTETLKNMESPLQALQIAIKDNSNDSFSWAFPYYAALYNLYSGKFAEVSRILKEDGGRLDLTTRAILNAYILIRDNRLDDAIASIKRLPTDLQSDKNIIMVEAYIIKLKYGPESQLRYFEEKQKTTCAWEIKQALADNLIEVGQIERGLTLLSEVARTRPFDVLVQLDLAEHLLYNKRPKEAFKILFTDLNSPVEYFNYNILMARIFLGKNDKTKTDKIAKVAGELSPDDLRFLWLKFNMSLQQKDYKTADNMIQQILDRDPNDITSLMSLFELRYLEGKKKEMLEVEQKLNSSQRYVGKQIADQVKAFKMSFK